MQFRSHEEQILDGALRAIFPLPADPDPARVEGVLTGYAGALAAIGRPVVAGPGEDDVEAPHPAIRGGSVPEIEDQLREVAVALSHRTEPVAS